MLLSLGANSVFKLLFVCKVRVDELTCFSSTLLTILTNENFYYLRYQFPRHWIKPAWKSITKGEMDFLAKLATLKAYVSFCSTFYATSGSKSCRNLILGSRIVQ